MYTYACLCVNVRPQYNYVYSLCTIYNTVKWQGEQQSRASCAAASSWPISDYTYVTIYMLHSTSIHHCHWHCVTNARMVNTIWCHMHHVDRAVSTDPDLCTYVYVYYAGATWIRHHLNVTATTTQWHIFTHSLIKPSVYCISDHEGMTIDEFL